MSFKEHYYIHLRPMLIDTSILKVEVNEVERDCSLSVPGVTKLAFGHVMWF